MEKNVFSMGSNLLNDTLEPPVIDFAQAELLSQTYPTPFLALSPTRIIKSIKTLREYLPGVKIYYAMKSNPDKQILQILKDRVDGIDVASYGESAICSEVGFTSDRIIHTNPIKRESDLKDSVKQGINWFVIDNFEEIKKIKKLALNANILLRVAIKNPNCTVNLSAKFGAHTHDILPILKLAKSEGLNVRGISFHVGSQSADPNIYYNSLKYVRQIFDDAADAGFTFDTLDVGGGFPISYRSVLPSLEQFCTTLGKGIQDFFPEELNILMEPGRCISGGCLTLVTRVVGKAIRNGIPWYYVDDGVYGAFSGKLFDMCDYRLVSNNPGALEECVVAGPTCDSIDIVANNQLLPHLEIGDLLLAPGMGAYTIASATSFNGFAPPRTILIDDENHNSEVNMKNEISNVRKYRYASGQR